MIPRYSRPQMAAIWEPENRFRIRLEIEAHACEAQAELGVIPESAARAVRERGAFEVERIDEIERETRHDVIAFLTNVAEHVGPEARFVHQGMTSSDVLDTCLAVQLTQAADILLADLDAAARGAEAARLRAQIHADRRAQPRHPRRADDLRAEARRALRRVRPQPRAPRRGAQGDRDLRDLGRGRHLRQYRPAGRGICRRKARPRARAGLDADHPARPPRRVLHGAGADRRRRSSGSRPRSAICSAPRCARPRSILRRGRRARRRCRTSATRSCRKT